VTVRVRRKKKSDDDGWLANRYQNQPWYIKLWRRRHYLSVPYDAYQSWRAWKGDETFRTCWGVSIGMAQARMKWFFTIEEIMDKHNWSKEERAEWYKPSGEKLDKCFCEDCNCEKDND